MKIIKFILLIVFSYLFYPTIVEILGSLFEPLLSLVYSDSLQISFVILVCLVAYIFDKREKKISFRRLLVKEIIGWVLIAVGTGFIGIVLLFALPELLYPPLTTPWIPMEVIIFLYTIFGLLFLTLGFSYVKEARSKRKVLKLTSTSSASVLTEEM